ncbi:MAG: hypothetical protein M9897_01975 [Brumimicrobium sp.]|nr:hypothetical protein [Brumimicrobium sp.]
MYTNLIAIKDTSKINQNINKIKQFAKSNNDKSLELEINLFSIYYTIEYRDKCSSDCVSSLIKIINEANTYQLKPIRIRAIRVLADYYWSKIRNYELAFEQYILLGKEIGTISYTDYPEKHRDLNMIGQSYYVFRDYKQAEYYLNRILELPEDDSNIMFMNAARNTLGLCYQKTR